MTPEQIVAFVLALTAPAQVDPLFPVIAAGGADPHYTVVAAECPRPLARFEIEGQTVACGTVSVPEDHENPEGRRIDLAFSQCAKDIGAAFLENPEAPFDASCAADLTPAFLLPDGRWSN